MTVRSFCSHLPVMPGLLPSPKIAGVTPTCDRIASAIHALPRISVKCIQAQGGHAGCARSGTWRAELPHRLHAGPNSSSWRRYSRSSDKRFRLLSICMYRTQNATSTMCPAWPERASSSRPPCRTLLRLGAQTQSLSVARLRTDPGETHSPCNQHHMHGADKTPRNTIDLGLRRRRSCPTAHRVRWASQPETPF
jgi:hypothetical protein